MQANNPPENTNYASPNNLINKMPCQVNRHRDAPFLFAEFTCARLSLRRLRIHAVHRVQLIQLIRPGRVCVLCHASVIPWPAGEKLSQRLVLCLQLRHMGGRSHVSRAGWCFHRLLGVCSRCKVGEVGLNPAEALDVLFRSHGVVHVELAEL